MKFDIRNPSEWERVQTADIKVFFAPNHKRQVKLTINSVGRTAVYLASDKEMRGRVLVGAGEGMFDIAFTASSTAYLMFENPEGHECFVRGHTADQTVHRDPDLEILTSVEPRNRRNSDFDRMQMLMKLNEKRRDEQMAETIAKLKAETMHKLEADMEARRKRNTRETVVESDDTPTPQPTPEPTPAPAEPEKD